MAKVFAPSSRRFLTDQCVQGCRLAIDLGCGPGHTTRLLADAVGAERTVGFDVSARYVASAASNQPTLEFMVHDSMVVPFPIGPADVIYARLLLAHLPEPDTVVARWLTQLTPGGRVLLDEIEYIRTTNQVLARYEEIVVALVASGGGHMYAGPLLTELVNVVSDRVETYPVTTADAARMFRMNLEVWRPDEFIRRTYPTRQIDQLAAELDVLMASPATGEIEWGLRQIALAPSSRHSA